MPVTSIFETLQVKGIQRKVLKPILRLKPEWIFIDGYFCFPEAELFLCGFLLDHKPSGSEINIHIQPLFRNELRFNLSYAEKIRGVAGTIERKGKSGKDIAEEFVRKTKPLIDRAKERDSLKEFVDYIEESRIYRNSRVCFDYGLALILQERYEEAEKYLSEVAESEWTIKCVPQEAKSASCLVKVLKANPKEAGGIVHSYLLANKKLLDKKLN